MSKTLKVLKEFIYFYKNFLDNKTKKSFIVLVIVSNLNSIAELVTISSIIPFFYLLSNNMGNLNSENIFLINYLNLFFGFSNNNLIFIVFSVVIFSVIFSLFFRLLFIYLSSSFTEKISVMISNNLLSSWLNSDYLSLKKKNSSNLIASITQKGISVSSTSTLILIILNNTFILFYFLIFLLFLNPIYTILSLFIFISLIFIINFFVNTLIYKNSLIITDNQYFFVKKTVEIIQMIKIIILSQKLNFFLNIHKKIAQNIFIKKAQNNILILSPKIIIESLFIILILLFTIFVYNKNQNLLVELLPLFLVYLYAFQKILPLANQIFVNISGIVASYGNLKDINQVLEEDKMNEYFDNTKIISFNKQLELKNICFAYDKENILKNLNLKIKKNEYLIIKGISGSGKSTLIEILVGLINPNSGEILIDDVKLSKLNKFFWFKKISYVSQNNYYTDESVDENIAFGESKLDLDKLNNAKNATEINKEIFGRNIEEINSVGENGNNLSGGQLQRIALARALYKSPELLIIDEGTGQLDISSESKIIGKIRQNYDNITIIHITHRNTILLKPDRIIKLNKINAT
jgi:ABC-type bacteriocin/lantibiotic exporter with double-glycine peptidase domain